MYKAKINWRLFMKMADTTRPLNAINNPAASTKLNPQN